MDKKTLNGIKTSMPGKVNPVICESVMQVCARVFGNDATVTWAAANGNFELNTMMPVMAHAMLENCRLLANVVEVFRTKCIEGLKANAERCGELVERSMAMALRRPSMTPPKAQQSRNYSAHVFR